MEDLSILHSAPTVGAYITVSVGGASMLPQSTESFLMLIDLADEALYQAKSLGKNQVVTYGQDRPFHPHTGGAPAKT